MAEITPEERAVLDAAKAYSHAYWIWRKSKESSKKFGLIQSIYFNAIDQQHRVARAYGKSVAEKEGEDA